MSSISPPSSPPTKSLGSTSLSPQNSSHLLSPQLLYRRFIPVSESPSNRQYHQKASVFRPSSPIAPSDGFEAVFLAACDKVEEDVEDFDTDLPNKSSEFIGNQAFIKGSESNSKEFESDEGIIESSDKNSKKSYFASNEEQLSGPASCGTGSQSIWNVWINDCSTENAKLKLIRILKGKALVPKQRWGIDKILATLVQHRKDPRLHILY